MNKIKKIIVLGLITVMLLCTFGCSSFNIGSTTKINNKYYVNKTSDISPTMTTIRGKKVENLKENSKWLGKSGDGAGCLATDTMVENLEYTLAGGSASKTGMAIRYVEKECMDYIDNFEGGSSAIVALPDEEYEEIMNYLEENTYYLYVIYAISTDEREAYLEDISSRYAHIEELGSYNDILYIFAYNNEFENMDTMPAEEVEIVKKMIAEKDEIFDSICLYEVSSDDSETNQQDVDLSSFSAQTLDGETVNQSIFADYDLTAINVWGTTCPFCVKEMPDLSELSGKLPDNVNLIGICYDGDSELEMAQEIISKNNITYINLVSNDEINELLLSKLSGYPTTIYVDKNGKSVGTFTVGAANGADTIADSYLAEIEAHLALLK